MSVCCECCVLSEVSASGWSLVQGSPSECGVYECDSESLSMRTPWPTRGCCAMVLYKNRDGLYYLPGRSGSDL